MIKLSLRKSCIKLKTLSIFKIQHFGKTPIFAVISFFLPLYCILYNIRYKYIWENVLYVYYNK